MQAEKYGMIDSKTGELVLADIKEADAYKGARACEIIAEEAKKSLAAEYKPVQYAEIPEFDQTAQAVFQGAAVDAGDKITVGVTVVDIGQEPEKEAGEIETPPAVKESTGKK